MTGIICDKCGDRLDYSKESPSGWVTVTSAVTGEKTDLCPLCKQAWEELRGPLLKRWLAEGPTP